MVACRRVVLFVAQWKVIWRSCVCAKITGVSVSWGSISLCQFYNLRICRATCDWMTESVVTCHLQESTKSKRYSCGHMSSANNNKRRTQFLSAIDRFAKWQEDKWFYPAVRFPINACRLTWMGRGWNLNAYIFFSWQRHFLRSCVSLFVKNWAKWSLLSHCNQMNRSDF